MNERIKNYAHGVKEWSKDHTNEIAMGAFLVGYAGFFAYVVKITSKAIEEDMAQQEAFYNDAISQGKTILPGPNGTSWAVKIDTTS